MRLKTIVMTLVCLLLAGSLEAEAIGLATGNEALAELHHDLAAKRLEAMQPILNSYRKKLDELTKVFLQGGNQDKARDAQEEKALIEAELSRLAKAEQETRVPAATPAVASPTLPPKPVMAQHTPKTYVSSIQGLAGATSFSENNVYKFTLPNAGTTSTLTFYATGRRSIDSMGNVWLINPAGEREKVLKWNDSYFKDPSTEVKTYKELKPISEDISRYVKGPGTYQVEFEWTGGIDPLVVYRVEITS